MSRVTRSTFRTATATTLALLASFGLASCGGGDENAPDRAGQPTAEPTRGPASSAAPIPAVLKGDVAVTKEGQKAISAASTKKVSDADVNAEAKALVKDLKAAGIKAATPSKAESGPAVVQSGSTTVIVYQSEQLAATQAASFIQVITTAKTDGRIARYGRAVIATSASEKMTKALQKEFDGIDKVVKKADL